MRFYNKVFLVFIGILMYGCSNFASTTDIYKDEFRKEKILLSTKSYSELIEINKEKLRKQDTKEIRLKLSQNYYDAKDYDSSLYYLKPLLQDDKNLDAFMLDAKTLDALGRYKEALDSINMVLDKKPTLARAYNIRGVIYAKLREFDKAEKDFLQAKEFLLDDEVINTNLGMLYILKRDYKVAVSYLMPLYMRGSKNETVLSNLILALVKEKKDKEALEIATKEHITRNQRKLIRVLRTSKIEAVSKFEIPEPPKTKGKVRVKKIKKAQASKEEKREEKVAESKDDKGAKELIESKKQDSKDLISKSEIPKDGLSQNALDTQSLEPKDISIEPLKQKDKVLR
ncbi:hypothetical protein [Helicobacter sp. 11S02629-2]|uniref:tetratricopeptide repeat protein n=1 Tax=Helicobacter sp. 11S02629-2 TaxID=1476195 RepID=UPI000BA69DAE|nr:hypothetical protein [Helicobacter sp. 11S02629-2]PAF45749.1 hypothetical protein BKH40_02415 [Helicobacter sp. 11S02629-2]